MFIHQHTISLSEFSLRKISLPSRSILWVFFFNTKLVLLLPRFTSLWSCYSNYDVIGFALWRHYIMTKKICRCRPTCSLNCRLKKETKSAHILHVHEIKIKLYNFFLICAMYMYMHEHKLHVTLHFNFIYFL